MIICTAIKNPQNYESNMFLSLVECNRVICLAQLYRLLNQGLHKFIHFFFFLVCQFNAKSNCLCLGQVKLKVNEDLKSSISFNLFNLICLNSHNKVTVQQKDMTSIWLFLSSRFFNGTFPKTCWMAQLFRCLAKLIQSNGFLLSSAIGFLTL